MLTKSQRFTREQVSALLLQKGLATVYNNLGTLKFLKSDRGLVVVTSSKHEKKAVSRNKIRRRIYSLFQGADIKISGILYLSKKSYSLEYSEIKKLFHDLLEKTSK